MSISPFGAHGPWADHPATEFTLQAACGSMGSRGTPERPPLPAGGRIGEWLTGTYAAVATLAATHDRRGRHVDVAMLDCMAVTLATYPSVFASFAGWPELKGTGRTVEVPSVEPTSDGYVVFTTNSAQQFQDFVVLIGRPDWLDDAGSEPGLKCAGPAATNSSMPYTSGPRPAAPSPPWRRRLPSESLRDPSWMGRRWPTSSSSSHGGSSSAPPVGGSGGRVCRIGSRGWGAAGRDRPRTGR